MDEQAPSSPPQPPAFQRLRSRRAILAGGAALAAGGAAAVVVGVAARSGNSGGDSGNERASTSPTPPATAGTGTATRATPAMRTNAMADPLRRAGHLLRRAGFGGTPAQIEEFAMLSREESASRLVDFQEIDNTALDQRIAAANFVLQRGAEGANRGQAIQDMQRWWLTRMAYTARPLEERMTYIWHGLLTSQVSKVGPLRAHFLVTQNELFRAHALGTYDDLVQAVAKDPAMLVYLDTVESTAEHPNENFPRELMELFTMGVGNYTEDDVRESARAFTGWRLNDPERPRLPANASEADIQKARDQAIAAYVPAYRFDARLHDDGTKTFLGRTGTWNGEDIIRIIMEQPATGRFIVTRLFSEFAYDDPAPEVVDRLAKIWESSGHDTREVVRAILVSDEFYSEEAYRAKVRSPIELVVGLIRGLEIEFSFQNAGDGGRGGAHASYYAGMDQVLFEPPSVAGWPGGQTWLSSSTLFARLNFLDQVLFPRGQALRLAAVTPASSAATIDDVAGRLVDGNLADAARAELIAHLDTIRDPAERTATAAYLIAGSPEFQLI